MKFRESIEKSNNVKTKSNRKINLDILRIIACFLVIVNHTNSRIFLSCNPSVTWFLSLTYFFISKVAVPIFVMISGALLLEKQEKYRVVFKKRILRMIMVIILFSLLYYTNNIVTNSKPFLIGEFLNNIIQNPITNAYWYLYMYLGLLVMLPILRKMSQNMETKDYIYCFAIWTVFIGIIPIINHYFKLEPITNYFELPLMSGYIVYFLMGYFIENKLDKKYFNKKVLAVLLILSILCIAMSVGLTYYEYIQVNKTSLFMDNRSFITIVIPSITLFYACKYAAIKREGMYENENKKQRKVINSIAMCTFGIYLLSDLLIKKFDFIYQMASVHVHKLLAIIALEIVVFIVGYMITWILKKIPFIKKLV